MAVIEDVSQLDINGVKYNIVDAEARKALENVMYSAIPPAQTGNLVFNGLPQTPTWNSNYDPEKMTLTVEAKTDAGTYSATFALVEGKNLKWNDGTTTPKTVNWTISRATAILPSPTGTKTYTGSPVSPSWDANYDTNKMTLGGDISGTNVGTYNANFTPTANYQWPDGSTGAKIVQWSIVKAAGSLGVSPASLTLDLSAMTKDITVTRSGTGAISAASSNSGIATVAVNGNKVSVTAVKAGSCEITISVAEDANYTAPASKKVSVNVSLPSSILSNNSFDNIAAAGAAGTGANYWSVGDTKAIKLNGNVGIKTYTNETLYMFIADFNYKGENGVYFHGFKSDRSGGIDVALCSWAAGSGSNGGYKTDGTKMFNMNHWGNYNYGGWAACDLRYDILGSTDKAPSGYGSAKTTSSVGYDATTAAITNPVANTLMAALPEDLRRNLKPITMYVDNKGNSSNVAANVTAIKDYLPLPTEFNIQGARSYANQYEQNHQTQFAYYKNGNSKVKRNYDRATNTNTAVRVWCSSPSYSSNNHFCFVDTDGSPNYGGADYAYGLAPFCRVA